MATESEDDSDSPTSLESESDLESDGPPPLQSESDSDYSSDSEGERPGLNERLAKASAHRLDGPCTFWICHWCGTKNPAAL